MSREKENRLTAKKNNPRVTIYKQREGRESPIGQCRKRKDRVLRSATFLRPQLSIITTTSPLPLPLPSSLCFSPTPRCYPIASQCFVNSSLPPREHRRGNASALILKSTVSSDRLVIVTSRESLPTTSLSLLKPLSSPFLGLVHPAGEPPSPGRSRRSYHRQSVVTRVLLRADYRSCDGRVSAVHNVHPIHGYRHPFYPSALRISSFLIPGDNLLPGSLHHRRGSYAQSLRLFDPFADHRHPPLRSTRQSRAGDIDPVGHGVPTKWLQRGPVARESKEKARLDRVLQEWHPQGGHCDR